MGKFINVSLGLLVSSVYLCSLFGGANAVSEKEDIAVTPAQQKILETFRQAMAPKLNMDYMKEDLYLLRWLKVKEFDMREAMRSLEDNLRWRKEKKMDTVHQEDWSDMMKDFPYSISDLGKISRLQRYMDKMMDVSFKVVDLRNQGQNVTRWTLLTNVEGFNVIQHACVQCTNLWINFLRSYESHFPSTANAILAINSPDSFNLVLRLIQPSIPKTSREAVKLFGGNKAESMTFLDNTIDRDQRTKEYGGTRE